MKKEKFISLFKIEDAEVASVKLDNNKLQLVIISHIYQYACGNGFRDEKEEACKTNYEFVLLKDITQDLSNLNYIKGSIVIGDDICLITNIGDIILKIAEVFIK